MPFRPPSGLLRVGFRPLHGQLIGALGLVIFEGSPEIHHAHDMSIDFPAPYLVATRLGEKRLSETAQKGAYHKDRAAKRRTPADEILRRDVVGVYIIGLENIVPFSFSLNLNAHAFKQAGNIAYVKYFWDIGHMYFLRGKKTSAYYLQ